MHVSEYDNNAIYTLFIALIALNCKLLDMYAQIKQTNQFFPSENLVKNNRVCRNGRIRIKILLSVLKLKKKKLFN